MGNLWLAAVAALLLGAPAAPGDAVTVKREGARLMKAPRFFGAACPGAVAPGAAVKLLEVRKGWARIASPGQGACWLHESAWSDRTPGALAGSGPGASARDVELAGRGFSEAEEARYRGEHPDLRAASAAIDAHLEQAPEPPPAEVSRFMADGRIGSAP
jgi:hypothetical protein